ncbi:MAG: LysE family translocator [Microcoleaceae cyanobacterium]
MENLLFAKGLLIGLSIAAPVGPIGILCIRRTLAEGRMTGFVSGLGAATADAVYGCVAGFGLTLISNFLQDQSVWFRLIGGGFLIYLGVKTALEKPTQNPATLSHSAGAYVSTFFLTLTNPATILSFVAVFSGLGLASSASNYFDATLLVLGVFLGSAMWWLLLVNGVNLFRTRLNHRLLRWINYFSGVVLITFGIIALATVRFSS